MLDRCRAPAQAIRAAPSGGSASAAAPVRPTSCGDGHGTTGADCRQDRRGTRSGFGVAAFSRTARSGAASGAASVRQGPVSAPPDGGSWSDRAVVFWFELLVRFRSVREAVVCAFEKSDRPLGHCFALPGAPRSRRSKADVAGSARAVSVRRRQRPRGGRISVESCRASSPVMNQADAAWPQLIARRVAPIAADRSCCPNNAFCCIC